LDAYSYYFNLTAANLTPNQLPQWQQLFSMRDDFVLPDLSPSSLDRLVSKLAHHPKLRHKHWQHTVKLGDTTLTKGCDNECMRMHICELVNNEVVDKRKCTSLMKGFK
jgi:sphingomyelin phosphodiesterase